MTPLAQYLRDASPDERQRTASLAGTSVGYLYQLAGCHRSNPSAALAVGIEHGTRTVAADSEGRLTPVSVGELATMCAAACFEREAT
jgi:hypothetical protein